MTNSYTNSDFAVAAAAGCEESQLLMNRRAVMGLTASLFTWGFMPKSAEASPNSDRRLLIVLLRGGLDGMHVAYNAREATVLSDYRTSMVNTGYLTSNYVNLDGEYRINKALPNFTKMFKGTNLPRKQASLVHAIAPPLRSRSHFDCMANVESGQPDLVNPGKDGWLNRFVNGVQEGVPLKRPLAMGNRPLILLGNAPVQSWGLAPLWNYNDSTFENILKQKYLAERPAWSNNLHAGLETHRLASSNSSPSSVVKTFTGAAQLMSANTGPRIGVLSIDGLDTHASQITVLDSILRNFDDGLEAFRLKMAQAGQWQNTVVVAVTEFGRTLQDRNTGTDHGTGTVAFLAGGGLNGGHVITDWPSIENSSLWDGRDLRATSDTRALFKGLLIEHLGCRHSRFLNETVFPHSNNLPAFRNLVVNPPADLSMKNGI